MVHEDRKSRLLHRTLADHVGRRALPISIYILLAEDETSVERVHALFRSWEVAVGICRPLGTGARLRRCRLAREVTRAGAQKLMSAPPTTVL